MDLKSVFDDPQTFEDDVKRREAEEASSRYSEENKRGIKRGIIGTAETYEQMAKKYREEQAKAYEEEHLKRSQQRVHPLDYLTDSYNRDSYDGSSGKPHVKDYKHRSAGAEQDESRAHTVGYEDSGRHYREKLFEDDDDQDGRSYRNNRTKHKYGDTAESQMHQSESRYSRRDDERYESEDRYYRQGSSGHSRSEEKPKPEDMDERKKRKPPQSYNSPKRDSNKSSKSQREDSRSKDRYSESVRLKQASTPPRDLAENDLRNVLIASDKASKRTVLPPKSDRERGKSTPSREEEPAQKRVISMLSTKDRERLEKEKEQRKKRLEILENELDKLRKQQGEMMRKKQRQKDGHKDPLLVENSKLQDEITKQITVLRKAVENQGAAAPVEETKAPKSAVKFKMEKVPKMVKVFLFIIIHSFDISIMLLPWIFL